jgi:hypothetical protein
MSGMKLKVGFGDISQHTEFCIPFIRVVLPYS